MLDYDYSRDKFDFFIDSMNYGSAYMMAIEIDDQDFVNHNHCD